MSRIILLDNPIELDPVTIKKEIADGNNVHIQFSSKIYNDELLLQINQLCAESDEKLLVRFYGHYNDKLDCNILSKIPHVKSLCVDSSEESAGISLLRELRELENLTIQVFELQDTEILSSPNFYHLRKLHFAETRSVKMNLAYLENYQQLKTLIIGGHIQNINSIGKNTALENLTLLQIKKVSLAFINELHALKSLRILHGSREDIAEIQNNNLEMLEIFSVRGFNSLENIDQFRTLKTLKLEDLAQLNHLDFKDSMPELEAIEILNCKAMKAISGFENLPGLKSLRIVGTMIEFDKLINLKLPPELTTLGFATSSSKLNKEINKKIADAGYNSPY